MPISDIKPEHYEALLTEKADRVEALYAEFSAPQAKRIASPVLAYRMRAEFRVWHEGDDLFYAMFRRDDPKTARRIDSFPIASERIQQAMPLLREALIPQQHLRQKLFQVEFLSTLSGELLVSLIYHRALDESWEVAARELETLLDAHVIGRSRKQKIVLSQDHVEECLQLDAGTFHYRQYEQSFTQPNAQVNCEMINWACQQAGNDAADLLELYCGNGNFTLPLSHCFEHVLATEVSKRSVRAAHYNREHNSVDNLEFARLSAEEVSAALAGEREFRRLKSLQRPLQQYTFSTLFVDPPRAGLDAATLSLAEGFDRIIYISCNPLTQVENLRSLCKTHRVESFAMFDQFPYTDHMECGVVLRRR